MIDDKQLSEIEARANAATKGPWFCVEFAGYFEAMAGKESYDAPAVFGGIRDYDPDAAQAQTNVTFAAHARTDAETGGGEC